jgi:hypothetical protein
VGRRRAWWVAAYLVHLAVVALFVLDVLPQRLDDPDRPFVVYHGGDELGYFGQAEAIVTWDWVPNKFPLGYPILLAPLVAVLRPGTAADLIPWVAPWWSLLMYPLAQVLAYRVALLLSGSRRVAVASVVGWALLPLACYLPVWVMGEPVAAETWSVAVTWLPMLSEGPTTLLTLLVVWLLLTGVDSGGRGWAVGVGAVCGFLTMTRYTAVVALLVVLVALVARRRFQAAALAAVAAAVAFLPQAVYNAHFFGSPLRTGYEVLDEQPPGGLFNLVHLRDGVADLAVRAGPAVYLVAVAAVVVAVLGLTALARRSRLGAWVSGAWIGGYVLAYASYWYSWPSNWIRFGMPVYPAAVVVGVAGLGRMASLVGRVRGRRRA